MSQKLFLNFWENAQFNGTRLLVLLAVADQVNDDGIGVIDLMRVANLARCQTTGEALECLSQLEYECWLSFTPDGSFLRVQLYDTNLRVGVES